MILTRLCVHCCVEEIYNYCDVIGRIYRNSSQLRNMVAFPFMSLKFLAQFFSPKMIILQQIHIKVKKMGGKIYNASQVVVEYLLCNVNDTVIQEHISSPQFDVSLENFIFQGFQRVQNFIINPQFSTAFQKIDPKSAIKDPFNNIDPVEFKLIVRVVIGNFVKYFRQDELIEKQENMQIKIRYDLSSRKLTEAELNAEILGIPREVGAGGGNTKEQEQDQDEEQKNAQILQKRFPKQSLYQELNNKLELAFKQRNSQN